MPRPMKNTKHILTLASGVLSLFFINSCELDEYNPSGSTADIIWSTPEGIETLVNACYQNQRAWYGKMDGVLASEVGTDLWFSQQKDGYAKEFVKYENFLPTTGNPNKALWPIMYEALNLCNAAIGRIQDVPYTSAEAKMAKEGEARFLRAFYLWHIVETWGGVYLPVTETKEVMLNAKRSSVEEFYNVIIEDLKFAVDNLPIDQGEEYTRATRKSAMGLLARAYISRAYYSNGSEAENYFTLARDVAREIIENQATLGVSLHNNYAELWNPQNNKRNKEALYVVGNSTGNPLLNYDLNANRLHMYFLTTYNTKPGMAISLEYGNEKERRTMPTLFLLDLFDETKDSRYEASFQEVWYANDSTKIPRWTQGEIDALELDPGLKGKRKFNVGDTALYVTKKSIENESDKWYVVVDRDSVYNTAGNGEIKLGKDYVPLIKYLDPITRTLPGEVPGFLDIIIIRLAEIYLIAAEAELQLGNPDAAAGYINVLRTRAAKKTPVDHTVDMQVNASEITLDFILDERGRELCGEHLRWFDLKRTHKLLERVQKNNPDIIYLQEHHYLRPVPQTEIDALLNGEEFGQNPGYN